MDLHTCNTFWNLHVPIISTSVLAKSVLVKYHLVAYSFVLFIGLATYKESLFRKKKQKNRRTLSQTGIRVIWSTCFSDYSLCTANHPSDWLTQSGEWENKHSSLSSLTPLFLPPCILQFENLANANYSVRQ